jgi:hypothetical protein
MGDTCTVRNNSKNINISCCTTEDVGDTLAYPADLLYIRVSAIEIRSIQADDCLICKLVWLHLVLLAADCKIPRKFDCHLTTSAFVATCRPGKLAHPLTSSLILASKEAEAAKDCLYLKSHYGGPPSVSHMVLGCCNRRCHRCFDIWCDGWCDGCCHWCCDWCCRR